MQNNHLLLLKKLPSCGCQLTPTHAGSVCWKAQQLTSRWPKKMWRISKFSCLRYNARICQGRHRRQQQLTELNSWLTVWPTGCWCVVAVCVCVCVCLGVCVCERVIVCVGRCTTVPVSVALSLSLSLACGKHALPLVSPPWATRPLIGSWGDAARDQMSSLHRQFYFSSSPVPLQSFALPAF